jgi:hypothetical protein
MTIEQLREYHIKHHVGFFWQCPYCAAMRAAAEKG